LEGILDAVLKCLPALALTSRLAEFGQETSASAELLGEKSHRIHQNGIRMVRNVDANFYAI
jgi:hypothetical protein